MPSPGDVFLCKDFRFLEGEIRDKLFVVLNNPKESEPLLGIITTSQSDRYIGAQQGCNEKLRVFYTPCKWQTCFDVDTYIQMPRIFPFPPDQIVEGGRGGCIKLIKTPLTKDCMDLLRGCLRKFTDDISPIYLSLVFNR